MCVKEVDLLKYAMGTPPEHKQEVHSSVRITVDERNSKKRNIDQYICGSILHTPEGVAGATQGWQGSALSIDVSQPSDGDLDPSPSQSRLAAEQVGGLSVRAGSSSAA